MPGMPEAFEPDEIADDDFHPMDPANASPLVAWLASDDAGYVNGQVIRALDDRIIWMQGWRERKTISNDETKWDATKLVRPHGRRGLRRPAPGPQVRTGLSNPETVRRATDRKPEEPAMTDAVIVAAARTPIGRARKGSLVGVDAFELAQVAVGEAIDRSGIPAADIDDVVVAESLQGGGVIARYVAVELGLTGVPGLADNRHCAAGLSAIQIGAASIRAGMDRVVVAGGTESLSTSPASFKRTRARSRPRAVDVAEPSRHPRRAALRHDHHRRQQLPRSRPA